MTLNNFIAELKRLLPETAWPWVFSALREDLIVWECLEGDVGVKVIEKGSIAPEDYSPAAFALTALNLEINPEQLRKKPMERVDTNIQIPEESTSRISRLASQGLAALKARERRRTNGSYQSVFENDRSMSPTAFACLYAMIPDPLEMLSGLMDLIHGGQATPDNVYSLVLHVILANPSTPQSQAPIIRNLLNGLSLSQKISFLKLLNVKRPQLASQLAASIVEGYLPPENEIQTGFDKLKYQLWAAEAWQIANNPQEEVSTLAETVKKSRQLQAKLTAQLARAASKNKDPQNALIAWEQALRLEPDVPARVGDYILTLIDYDRYPEARQRLQIYQTSQPHPKLLLARAIQDQRDGEIQSARENAKKALSLLTKGVEPDHIGPDDHTNLVKESPDSLTNLLRLTTLFLQLNAPYEAVQAIRKLLVNRPNRVDCLDLAVKVYRYAGDPKSAAQVAHLAVLFAPEHTDLHQQLIHALEAAGDWQGALRERRASFDHLDSLSIAERLAYARCSLQAGSPQGAIEICEHIVQDGPNEGQAYALMGEAYYALGEPPKAIDQLDLATQLCPSQPLPWTTLARIHSESGLPDKALEVLKAGVQTSPNLPELHLAIGEHHSAQESPTQALNAFKKAADLIGLHTNESPPFDLQTKRGSDGSHEAREVNQLDEASLRERQRNAQIALRLGQTLQQLGHLQEAHQILNVAYANFPFDSSIAYAYAKILIELDKLSQAIEPLNIVLGTAPNQAAPYLDYAACLLSLHTLTPQQEPTPISMNQALEAIQAALELDPDCNEAKAYLAEAFYAKGEFQRSLEAYRQALETDLSSDPIWFSRLSLGLGQVALELGHIETAIAALQEANQVDPVKVNVKRKLAEAYQAAGLHQEAYQTAQAALHQAPDDLETLIWFAEHILSLGDNLEFTSATAESEAIDVLIRALQIDPYRTDLAARLGHIYLKTGQNGLAKETFLGLISEEMSDPINGYHSTSRDVITDLHQAARGFLHLGEAQSAVESLQCALQTKPKDRTEEGHQSPGSSTSLFTLLADLSLAYQFSGDYHSALQTLDQAIPLAEDKTPLFITKADLYLDLQEYFDALETLTTAVDADADNPNLHYRLAIIQRAAGNISEALESANTALSLSPSADTWRHYAEIVALAVRLHQAQLQDEPANQMLIDSWELLTEKTAQALKKVDHNIQQHLPGILDYFCAHAEICIGSGDIEKAFQDLEVLLEISPDHPWVMAVQARLAAHRLDPDGNLHAESERLLDTALAQLAQEGDQEPVEHEEGEQYPSIELDTISHPQSAAFYRVRDQLRRLSFSQAVGEAALDLNRWSTAIELFEKVSKSSPTEPKAHLSFARLLVIAAEYQRICEELEAFGHAPGKITLEEEAYQKFKDSIELAETFLKSPVDENPDQAQDSDSKNDSPMLPIRRWYARGEAVFHPSFQNAEKLSELAANPEDIAAHISCLRLIGDTESAVLAANAASDHPLVLAQLALALVSENPRQSLAAAHAAVEILADASGKESQDTVGIGSRNMAIIHALAARLVHRLGNRSSDQKVALDAIRVALAIWPNEPRWHYLAAEIHLKSEDPDITSARMAAVAHLEDAFTLEPNNPAHPLELGRIFLLEDNPDQAILCLEKATQLKSDLAAAWLHLARAQRRVGEIEQALVSAEKAVSLSPGEIAPLLLRGEVALLAEDADRALEFAEKTLHLNGENPSALLLKARSLSELDQPESALEAIETALPYADDPLPLFLERIRLIQSAQGSETALESVQGLAKAYPDEPKVLACLARHLENTNRGEEAIQAIQRAIRAEGISSPPTAAERSEMHHLLGRLLNNAGQLDQAIHHLTEAIRLNSRQVEPYLELGRVHQERRQHAQALKAYEQAIAARPDDHRPYFQAGVALKENKDYLGSERMLRKAAELAPNDIGVHRMLGAVVALNLVHNRRKASINP